MMLDLRTKGLSVWGILSLLSACGGSGSTKDVDPCANSEECVGAYAVTVSNVEARGCELLLEQEPTTQSRVTFSDGARGTTEYEGNRFSVSVITREDGAFASDAVRISVLESAEDASNEVRLVRSRCVNRLGVPLEGAPGGEGVVTLERMP